MNGLSLRLRNALEEKGMSQAKLAKNIGVSQQSIQYLCSGKAQGTTHAIEIADALEISPSWLLTGKNKETYKPSLNIESEQASDEVKAKNKQGKLIPLVSWVAAGTFNENTDPFAMGDADEFYPCPTKHSESTFALKVVGLSMYPEFSPGEVIYIDPEVEASNGSFVVVRQNNDSEATFKQLKVMGDTRFLQAVNQSMPDLIEMLPDANICGVVIGSYKERK
jgi:SOS-response transcriptional repressor LexA